MSNEGTITRIVQILCEHHGRRIGAEEIEIVADLEIVDLYAARVADEAEFLVHPGAGTLERVRFEAWPPARPESRLRRAGEQHASPPRTRRAEDSNRTTPGNPRSSAMRIDQFMSRQVQHCTPEASLDSAAYLMWSNDCGVVPVCAGSDGDDARVVGMLTDRDICMAALFQGKPLSELRVSDAMSREVCSCRPSDRPADVEKVMRARQIRRVPVTDPNGHLLGIVSLADLAREAANGGSTSKRGVSESEIGSTLSAICARSHREPSGVHAGSGDFAAR